MPPSQFFAYMVRPLGRITQFSGRSGRAVFWPYMVLLAIVYLCALTGAMLGMVSFGGTLPFLFLAVGLLVTLAYAAVVRRMHDVGWSGWWMSAYVVLVWMFIASAFAFRLRSGSGNDGSMAIWGVSAVVNLAQSGLALLIFVVCCFKGQPDDNSFGPSPREP